MVILVIVIVFNDDRGHGARETGEEGRARAGSIAGNAAVAIEARHDRSRLRDVVAGLVERGDDDLRAGLDGSRQWWPTVRLINVLHAGTLAVHLAYLSKNKICKPYCLVRKPSHF